MPEKKQRIESLQALRALAFLGIFSFHSDLTDLGVWGVSVFLILSGFLMFYSYCERDLDTSFLASCKFSINKIKKLYPLHILMMLTALVFVIRQFYFGFTLEAFKYYFIQLILNLTLTQAWFPSSEMNFSLNGVAWYLSVCLFIYFCFPFTLKFLKKIKSKWAAVALMITVFLLQMFIAYIFRRAESHIELIDDIPKWLTYICPAYRYGDFLIGCCLGYIFKNRKLNPGIVLASIFEIVTGAAVIFAILSYRFSIGFMSNHYLKFDTLFTFSSCLLVYAFACKAGILTKIFSNKPLIYLGNISSFTFLIHQELINYMDIIWNKVFTISVNVWVKSLLLLAMTIVCAVLYSEIEDIFRKKFLQSKHK